MFVYDESANIVVYALFASFLIGANSTYDRSIRVARYLSTICLSICAAIIANIANLGLYAIAINNSSGYGQSWIVYGIMGAITAITLFDFLIYSLILLRRVRKHPIGLRIRKTLDRKFPRIITSIFVVLILLFTIVYAFNDPRNFFSVAPGVDSFVHLISFGSGAIISVCLLYKYREKLMWISEVPRKRNLA